MRRLLSCFVLLGSIACGAFLADTGDDEVPRSPDPDAASGDGSTTVEGGSLVDGSAQPDADPAFERRATCGANICEPGVPCCVSKLGGACVVGEMTCNGSELSCTRNPDCAPGETCCITLQSVTLAFSSSTCVKGDCPGGSDVICSTQDGPLDQGCGPLTCKAGVKASSYGLPAADPWGVCE